MDLDTFLKQPGSMSTAELARRIGVKHVAQVNQWRNPNQDRRPDAANCVAIEKATGGAVHRWDLRPDDWHLIWPELKKVKGAPAIKAEA